MDSYLKLFIVPWLVLLKVIYFLTFLTVVLRLSWFFCLKSFDKVWKRFVVADNLEWLLKKDIFLDFDDDLDLVGRLDVKLSIDKDFFFFI